MTCLHSVLLMRWAGMESSYPDPTLLYLLGRAVSCLTVVPWEVVEWSCTHLLAFSLTFMYRYPDIHIHTSKIDREQICMGGPHVAKCAAWSLWFHSHRDRCPHFHSFICSCSLSLPPSLPPSSLFPHFLTYSHFSGYSLTHTSMWNILESDPSHLLNLTFLQHAGLTGEQASATPCSPMCPPLQELHTQMHPQSKGTDPLIPLMLQLNSCLLNNELSKPYPHVVGTLVLSALGPWLLCCWREGVVLNL